MSWPTGFLNPERLGWLFLIVPLIVFYMWASLRKRRFGMRFTNTTVLQAVMPQRSQWRRHLAVALTLLSFAAITCAWARPNGVDRVPRERATIVVVIDISQSMLAKDVKPTRLEAAKERSKTFVDALPPTYNVSVVSLSGNPALRVPPTTDRAMVKRSIDALSVQDSTAIGGAIDTALGAISMAPKGDGNVLPPGAIVMLSDGTNTAGTSPVQAAERAAKDKVAIYTIAYGTDVGSVDLDGKRERVPPDRELMKTLSSITKGTAWTAENTAELDSVYKNVATQVGYEEVKKEVTALWAGYALAFAVLAAVAAVSLGARWP